MNTEKNSSDFYNSGGKHKTRINGVKTKNYVVWRAMIRRCYKPEMQKRHPTYIGCSICDEWQDFQVFAEWSENQKHSNCGYQLDKDILVNGNKLYSPDTCCFVPRDLNMLLIDSGASRGEHPQGVSFKKDVGRFYAGLRMYGKYKHIGYYECAEKAYQAYKEAKERHVKNVAIEWANRIEWNVFVALMNWRLAEY